MIEPLPCPECLCTPEPDRCRVQCINCYDGAPDSPNRSMYGVGHTVEEAVREWNAKVTMHELIPKGPDWLERHRKLMAPLRPKRRGVKA